MNISHNDITTEYDRCITLFSPTLPVPSNHGRHLPMPHFANPSPTAGNHFLPSSNSRSETSNYVTPPVVQIGPRDPVAFGTMKAGWQEAVRKHLGSNHSFSKCTDVFLWAVNVVRHITVSPHAFSFCPMFSDGNSKKPPEDDLRVKRRQAGRNYHRVDWS